MKYSGYRLIPGVESEEKINLLIEIANIRSPNKRLALIDHLVNKTSQSVCAVLYKLSQSTIGDAVASLNEKHALACKVVECNSRPHI